MTTYTLNIEIDTAGLHKIYNSKQSVTLVKSVGSSPANVAWISFQPFGSNIVTWTEDYVIYGTTATVESGASIKMTSQTAGAAQEGLLYTFAEGQFSGAQGGAAGSYDMVNHQKDNIYFGLAQSASINGAPTLAAPLNAVEVDLDESATFTPIETVSVYLTSYENNGVVITGVAGNALLVTLTSDAPSASLGFDDVHNAFYLSSGAALTHADLARRPGSGTRPKLAAAR